jgi:hypothetical protein
MILSLILALGIIAGTIALVVRGVKMARESGRRGALVVFVVIAALALAAGIQFGVFGEYNAGPRMRIGGAPVPLVIFVLEGVNWTDFVKPEGVTDVCMAANALFPVGVFALVWVVAGRVLGRKAVQGDPIMNTDIDAIIERLRIEHPSVKMRRLKVSYKADDDGLWFFSTDKKVEVQLESPTGNFPFLFESSANDKRADVRTIGEAINFICGELGVK